MMKKEEEKAKGKGQMAKGEEQRAESKGQRAKNAKMQECENACPNESVRRAGMPVRQEGGHECGTTDNNSSVSQFDNLTNEISTVFQIKKPSATETRFPAEGCISEPQAIRACLTIRVFNNQFNK